MTNEIQDMILKLRKFSDERNWKKFHNPKDLAIALQLEASEVLENFRFKTNYDKEEVGKELADVLNVLLRISDIIEVDIIYYFNLKLEEKH